VRFERRFVDKRRQGLQFFLKYAHLRLRRRTDGGSCVLLNPEFSASPVLKDFLFS
jgi:hypothetical protein